MPRATHWDLEFCQWTGPDAGLRRQAQLRYTRGFGSDQTDFVAYDPFAVEVRQRNQPLTDADLVALDARHQDTHQKLYSALGAAGERQVRVLLCDGQRLLAWVGLVREEPFDDTHVALLRRAVKPLRDRFRLLNRFPLRSEALVEVLMALQTEPVLLLRCDGRVELANPAAEAMLEARGGRDELSELRKQLQSGQHGSQHDGARYQLTQLAGRGMPGYMLAVRKVAPSLTTRVAKAKAAWSLSARLSAVLEAVCTGLSNKEIAAQLACSEVTVERHVTRLFRASGARTRTQLVARVYQL